MRKFFIGTGIVLASFCVLVISGFHVLQVLGKSRLSQNAVTALPIAVTGQYLEADEQKQHWQEGWIKYNDKVYEYNQDILTFLIMGIDREQAEQRVEDGTQGGQADCLFLVVLNAKNKKVNVIGLNRNTMTDIEIYDEKGEYVETIVAQLAVQHGFGNGVEKSCEYQVKAVSKLMYNLPVHGYAAINMSGISMLNDAIGGVELRVLEDITCADVALVKGEMVHLEEKSAYWYVRYRDYETFGSADARLVRQKQYLTTFIQSAANATKKDISIPMKLYHALDPMMTTNITIDEVAYLSFTAIDYEFAQTDFHMLPGETVMGERFEEFYADESALYEMIIDLFYEEVEIKK